MRDTETVTALELFFDVVFVLAITQSTAYMAEHATWTGLLQGVLILAVLWWGWVGYAWLTSVVDPEEGFVRLAVFAAMAALLVVSLAIPESFDDLGLLFAAAYAIFRLGQIALFMIASRDDASLRSSVLGLFGSTAFGVGLLVIASATDGALQIALWAVAISGDVIGPYIWGADGWRIEPGHFAERHRLIIIIALGESIVAIGAGAGYETSATTSK
jgi:low temperature requirement protein LtrA